MKESLGSILKKARQSRGLSCEDVGRALRMKASRIAEIEDDEYSNFPNLAYARGFVLIYGKFLKVDAKPFLRDFDAPTAIQPAVSVYQKVATPVTTTAEGRRAFRRSEDVKKSFLPFIAVILFGFFVIAGGLTWAFILNLQRLGDIRAIEEKNEAAGAGDPVPVASETSEATPTPEPVVADPTPVPTVTSETSQPSMPSPDEILAGQAPLPDESVPTEPEMPIEELPVATDDAPSGDAAEVTTTELTIRPLRRTFVKVIVDENTAAPAHQDYLDPRAAPLRVSGKNFRLELRDRTAVEVLRNGVAVPLTTNRPFIE